MRFTNDIDQHNKTLSTVNPLSGITGQIRGNYTPVQL